MKTSDTMVTSRVRVLALCYCLLFVRIRFTHGSNTITIGPLHNTKRKYDLHRTISNSIKTSPTAALPSLFRTRPNHPSKYTTNNNLNQRQIIPVSTNTDGPDEVQTSVPFWPPWPFNLLQQEKSPQQTSGDNIFRQSQKPFPYKTGPVLFFRYFRQRTKLGIYQLQQGMFNRVVLNNVLSSYMHF